MLRDLGPAIIIAVGVLTILWCMPWHTLRRK